MNTGPRGIELVKSFEGLSLSLYRDVVGKATIGYGHLVLPNESFSAPITEAQAEAILRKDLGISERGVNKLVKAAINQNQFDALVSFTFNLGVGSLQGSTLLKKLNAGDYAGAADEFLRWDNAGGKQVSGLTRRRVAERALFLS